MSRLILIRHGQASLSTDPHRAFHDYDRLTPLGVRQSEALGLELAAAGTLFDRVIVGPSVRHAQTAEAAADACRTEGVRWPDVEVLGDLGEHSGSSVVERALEDPGDDAELVALKQAIAEADDRGRTRAYFRAFGAITRRWVRRALPERLGVEEDWQAFRARVEAGVRRIVDSSDGRTVGVFTSGGPIGSTVALALGLDDPAALELAFVVQNATVTELRVRDGRVRLRSFNTQPRLGSRELHTDV